MSGKDALKVFSASGNDLATAVVKATNHDEVPPKPKHVQSTCSLLFFFFCLPFVVLTLSPAAKQTEKKKTDYST